VCLLITFVSASKTTETIEMQFVGGGGDSGKPKEPHIRWRLIFLYRKGQFWGLFGSSNTNLSQCCDSSQDKKLRLE